MPCPLFEPKSKVVQPRIPAPRLPLLNEFEGICHAGENVVDPEHRFHFCNRGNAREACSSFPKSLNVSAVRFTVTAATGQILTVLVIEEENHRPANWFKIDFMIEDQRLEPEIGDVCRRAQLFHFCASYLESKHG